MEALLLGIKLTFCYLCLGVTVPVVSVSAAFIQSEAACGQIGREEAMYSNPSLSISLYFSSCI